MRRKHVELNRSFSQISKEKIFEGDYDFLNGWGLVETRKWDDLRNLYRVVILAEAGAGKTEEMKAITKRLREEGKRAFFLRLEHLCTSLEASFDVGSLEEFSGWLSSKEPGWFFLDSVDEARLKGAHQFEEAIRKFAYQLGDNAERAHIYIASRVSEWRHKTDLEFIADKLPSKEISISNEEQSSDVAKSTQQKLRKNSITKSQNSVEPLIFGLSPLDENQILVYSREFGVNDPEKFLSEIKKKEAEIYAKRPLDLDDLIDFWKKHASIGSHGTMLHESISSRLKERDPDHGAVLSLTDDEARYGAEILAAALTFQKKSRILIPDGDIVANEETINPRDILTGWIDNKINALLQRPIFDGAIYGTVRFHHRSVREYLTARWLLHLLELGKPRRAIEALFFAERYGQHVLVPSMRPILSWLLLWNDKIREKAVEIAPEVLIQGGDPSSLHVAVRKNALEKYCKVYAYHKNGRFNLTEVSRFANREIADTIKQLLIDYRENENLCQLLLQMIWQGDVTECSDEAFAFALDNSQNDYTRIYGIRAINVVGSIQQKEKLVKSFLPELVAPNDGSLLGELISAFSPSVFKMQDILVLLKSVKIESDSLNVVLHTALREVVKNKWTIPELVAFIDGVTLLLKEPPVIEKRSFEVSGRYAWLMPFSFLAVERLIKCRNLNAFNESSLSLLSIAPEERTFVQYFHKEEHSLAQLTCEWPELNYALFWFNVLSSRKQLEGREERLTDFWGLKIWQHYWKFTKKDFDVLIDAIRNKTTIDDKLMALSLAFAIYRENGRDAELRKKLKKAVHGQGELEEKLRSYLNPPRMSVETKKHRRLNKNFERQQANRDKKEADSRQKWLEWLKTNTAVLRDVSIAPAGSIWGGTHYLLQEIWHKQNNHNQWARSDWEVLIPEFGRDVAEAYRDGCIGYWRKYNPKIQSEQKESQKGTPNAVIIGLSGLMMEAQSNPDWPQGLSEDEARLACRYAVEELNGFPIWLKILHSAFPGIVEERILAEIEWEFTKFNGESPCHYVLDDVNWHTDWLKPKISQNILSYLEKYEPRYDDTVKKALEIVLVNPNLNKTQFTSIAKAKIGKAISDERKAIWLAAWIGIESEQAFNHLKEFLANIGDEKATTAAMVFLRELLGTRTERRNQIYSDYEKPSTLLSLYRLMHVYIRRCDDIQHKGCYSPGLRDDAQDARGRLLHLLKDIPGKETYQALLELSNEENGDVKEWYMSLAHRRAELDAEPSVWQSIDTSSFANQAEKSPSTHRELFDLIFFRLLDLKDEFENGATSNAPAFHDILDETKHRIYIGGWLRNCCAGRYSISHENELADATRPDLYVFSNSIAGEVPIELKIADSWTVKVLEERLKNQLCGQYLRDPHSTCGIFLLIYCGKEYWEHPTTKEHLNFSQLIAFLENIAAEILIKDKKIESIQVVGIDLTKRTIPKKISLADEGLSQSVNK